MRGGGGGTVFIFRLKAIIHRPVEVCDCSGKENKAMKELGFFSSIKV